MNVAHDKKAGFTGAAQGRAGDEFTEPGSSIDWENLRSRLFAAYGMQARPEPLDTPERMRLRLRGSFDGSAASVLHTYDEASRSVNPDASSNGKPEQDNIFPATGESGTGGRGWK